MIYDHWCLSNLISTFGIPQRMASRKIFRNHPSMSCGGCGYRARLVQSGTNIVGPSASELSTFEVTWRCHCQNCSSSTADIELPERTTFLRCNMDKLQRPLNTWSHTGNKTNKINKTREVKCIRIPGEWDRGPIQGNRVAVPLLAGYWMLWM